MARAPVHASHLCLPPTTLDLCQWGTRRHGKGCLRKKQGSDDGDWRVFLSELGADRRTKIEATLAQMKVDPSMLLSPLRVIGVITVSIVTCNVTIAVAIPLTPFRFEAQARRYCPFDAIVWLDFQKGIYYSKGQRQYARGFNGSFVCRDEARRSGYRRSLLGLR